MSNWLFPYLRALQLITLLFACAANAQQFDINAPPGSNAFGTKVAVLPNGNIVVTDPDWNTDFGAVYLYAPDGQTLISTLTGGTSGDHVGRGGITVLGGGNYLVSSPGWTNPKTGAASAGAVTFCYMSTGVGDAIVDDTNSLVGSHANDSVGLLIFLLANHNYVVDSYAWNGGMGAVTWGNGAFGITGEVSSTNSLVGSTAGDTVGYPVLGNGVVPLNNGNYVVVSPHWTDSTAGASNAGAVTWADGNGGLSGPVSEANSLHGTIANDYVGFGGVVGLGASGNYVVNSYAWNNGTAGANFGAVTWAGNSGITGAVSTANSLYGTHSSDLIGRTDNAGPGVTVLSNGNYAVASSSWNGGIGAITWGSGSTGIRGAVTAVNSFLGGMAGDKLGASGIAALSNGNYVAASPFWSGNKGAVTWLSGTAASTGTPSSANSLTGAAVNDDVGSRIYPLTNGNYVVVSPGFNSSTGAATWSSGASSAASTKGVVSSANSLLGTATGASLGNTFAVLSNGNYVVGCRYCSGNAGAATWGSGTSGVKGAVTAANSLHGSTAGDQVGANIYALSNGNYVVVSPLWSSTSSDVGAVTWGNGNGGSRGAISSSNSLVGFWQNDLIGTGVLASFRALTNGSYVVPSSDWSNNGTVSSAGAITLQRGNGPYAGFIDAKNSVLGAAPGSGDTMVFDYDAARDQLVVGRPAENIVTLLRADELFKSNFEAQ